jgi:hypothetical protein
MKIRDLNIGSKYSKIDLSNILRNSNISFVREGVYHLNDSESIYFVDLIKTGKEERFHFDDFFEEDFFHWDSQTPHHIKSPKIQEVVNGLRTPYLFARMVPKIKSKTQPFIYCGKLKYIKYEEGTSKPVHIIFQNTDYQENTKVQDLIDLYSWKPDNIGKTTKSKISMKGVISKKRKREYSKPNSTERRGLITSRVGQGYYRQQIREKWNYECPVTGCKILDILIASHIVPWSESNDFERLDVENGILLSPDIDALFDKHLISFSNSGNIIFSDIVTNEEIDNLGINKNIIINTSNGMKKYLKRHRELLR